MSELLYISRLARIYARRIVHIIDVRTQPTCSHKRILILSHDKLPTGSRETGQSGSTTISGFSPLKMLCIRLQSSRERIPMLLDPSTSYKRIGFVKHLPLL